jgi:hypothetical protein
MIGLSLDSHAIQWTNWQSRLLAGTCRRQSGGRRHGTTAAGIKGGNIVSATIINLIIQIIAGAIGGNAAGATMEKANLGTTGNTIAGALGGLGGGQLLSALIPALAGSAGGVDLASIAGQLVGGGVSGAIVTAIVGLIMNAMAKR